MELKVFKAFVTVHGEVTYEDPHCPSFWRGSGCYDITEDVKVDATCYVCASSEERARQLVEKASFESDEFVTTDVEIDSIEFQETMEVDGEEVYDIEIERLPEPWEPDPDDCRDDD